MNNHLYIIILNWNGYDDSIECINSIRNNDFDSYTTILVDNGSEKENLEQLKIWCKINFPTYILYNREQAEKGGVIHLENKLKSTRSKDKIVFIENNENLGFAAGNNVALKYVLLKNATYAMLLNNDTIIEPDSISILLNFIDSHNNYIAVTPQIRYFEPNDIIWNCGGRITWFGTRKYYFQGKHISKVPQSGFKRITFITGCALLFKPSITGILTEKFFFGEEDMEFSFRQKLEKRKIACCFPSIIYHKVSSSAKKRNANILGSTYLHYLSRLINNRQYSTKLMFLIKTLILLGYAIPMIRIRYKISSIKILRMIKTLFKELRRIDEINKAYTMKYLKEDFSK